ncbi:unnamed protein product [Thelazia callipaeda]|uniref:ABC transporter ATP-binding protein n=1 Tax=Thelazia callipaeda TaxID=103827 RepID=A0A0N5DA81_THECL|nr:unnamed protein product [Thelazia callipaeda]
MLKEAVVEIKIAFSATLRMRYGPGVLPVDMAS